MNKIVFLMDTAGNAVQWAAGMSLRVCLPEQVEARRADGAPVLSWLKVDPHDCVSHFVRALCACPDGSLLEWDEAAGVVECKTWIEPPAPVATPEPSLLPDGRPVIPVTGHPKWRELYEDEVIQEGDRAESAGVFSESVTLSSFCLYLNEPVSVYRERRLKSRAKVFRRLKPKKQKKAGEG